MVASPVPKQYVLQNSQHYRKRAKAFNENEKTGQKEKKVEEEEKEEEEKEEKEEDEEGEEEEELEEHESEESEVKDTIETETFPFEGRVCVKQQRNSPREESNYTTSQNGMMNGLSEAAIQILRKSGPFNRKQNGSNGCCRENNIQIISQV